jgi:hypothetical protein
LGELGDGFQDAFFEPGGWFGARGEHEQPVGVGRERVHQSLAGGAGLEVLHRRASLGTVEQVEGQLGRHLVEVGAVHGPHDGTSAS